MKLSASLIFGLTSADGVKQPWEAECMGECCDIETLGMFKALEYTDELAHGSKVTVGCKQHYMLNIDYPADPYVYGKLKTAATCRCNSEQKCKWVFNKGQVMCSWCPREFLQARKGKRQSFIEWDDGIAIYYPIQVDLSKSTDGWAAALDFNAEIQGFDQNRTRRADEDFPMASAMLVSEDMMDEHFKRSRRDTEERARRHAEIQEANEADPGDDIRYTQCQADILGRHGFKVPESHITDTPGANCDGASSGEDDGWGNPRAIDSSAPKWNRNFDSAQNKYLVPFYFTDAEGVWSDSAKITVRNKLAEFGRDTCVKLVEVDEDDQSDGGKFANTFRVLRSQGCMSYVGRHFQNQDIWLNAGCEHSYVPLHEFMHGLGWWHEQQRGDYRDHVKLWPERCYMTGGGWDSNFGTVGEALGRWGDDGTPYDFGSIMHYSARACAIGSEPVITKPDGSEITLTKTSSLSALDIAAINMAYPCGDDPEPTVEPTTEPGTWEPTGPMSTTSEYWTEDSSTTEEYRSTTKEYTTEEYTTGTTVPPIHVFGGNMENTGVSDYGRIWTFVPNTELLNAENLESSKVWLMAYFQNLTPEDIQNAKNAALLYFKEPNYDASCLVDRFEWYPLAGQGNPQADPSNQ